MTSKPLAALLVDLDVLKSHSRPKVNNDYPYSKSWFKTLKYLSHFPERFASLAHTRDFIDWFVQAHNGQHRHPEVGFQTPADVRHGLTRHVDDQRLSALRRAGEEYPNVLGSVIYRRSSNCLRSRGSMSSLGRRKENKCRLPSTRCSCVTWKFKIGRNHRHGEGI